jgi:hypothetical protein
LFIYGRHGLRAKARLIKQFAYEISEHVRGLLPEYKRRARKVNILQRI